MILLIKYLPDEQLAELTLKPASPTVWPNIRRICEEATDETCNQSISSLIIPWWAFLKCREDIAYAVNDQNITLQADRAAQHFLVSARSHEGSFQKPVFNLPRSKSSLIAKLGSLGFIRRLTKEQMRNIRKLAAFDAAATFSVPGAGKTTEAIAYYILRRASKAHLLVVAPKNAFAVWEEQIRLCLKRPYSVYRLQGGFRSIKTALADNPDVMLVTYQQLATVRHLVAQHMSQHSCFMFLDESHRMKRGTQGLLGSTVLSVCHLPVSKLIMSGTPLPNSLDDLVSQFSFLYPEIRASVNNITELMKPIYVRTTKAELKLPPIRRRIIELPLNPGQRDFYELVRSEAARQAANTLEAGDRIALRSLGQAAVRLLQIASNPSLLASASVPAKLFQGLIGEGDSPKIKYVCERVRYLASKGMKSIVWSCFVPNVELIASRLKDLGSDYIHGGVEAGSEEEAETRESKIKRFHEDSEAWVLVANPAACGESISLHTVCHHAIYLDRNYNAAQYIQSEDRIHRLGLSPKVRTVIEIVTAIDSIDESVRRRLELKTRRMSKVLNDPSLTIEATSVELDSEELDEDDINDLIKHLRKF